MTPNGKDQVDLEALSAAPMRYRAPGRDVLLGSDYWINQENGMRGPQWRPSRDDVEAMLER